MNVVVGTMIEIPNYEIGKLAGRGGVAEVYLARHKLLDRTVAIKLISPAHADDLADKRFLKEAKVMAGLRHPNIVSVYDVGVLSNYDVGVLSNKYYIIMEYLGGGDLKQSTKQGLSISRSLAIIRQIASALAYAHDKGFIHRDIKSQNIMFRSDGTAVLTDFGIVKDLTAETGYTLDGTSIGTPHYMSPEQAQGTARVDWRTDLYSLGVTFFEMLTGSVPYNADSAIAVALKHIKEPVPRLPGHLARFQPVIDRLMAKNPKDRFQSAHDLIRAIDRLEGKAQDDDQATEAIPSSLIAGRKISPARIFTAVALISIMGGMVMLNWPRLARLMERHKLLERPRAENVHRVGSGGPEPAESKSSWKDVHKTGRWRVIDDKRLSNAIATKDYTGALAYLTRIRRDLPAPSNEMLIKADRSLEGGQLINAADIYNTIVSVDPENTSAVLGLLSAAIQKQIEATGRQDASIADYESLLALLDKAVKNTDARFFKLLEINTIESLLESARRRFEQSDLTGAAHWVQAGLKYAPDHLRLKKLDYRIKARISFNEGRLALPEGDNALMYYRQILLIDPEDPDAREGVARIVDQYREMARAAQDSGKYENAAELIGRARSISPADDQLKLAEWMILGDMYFEKHQYKLPENENALEYYRKVLVLDPGRSRAARRVAEIEVLAPLQEVRRTAAFDEKVRAYRTLFASFESAAGRFDSHEVGSLRQLMVSQVKSDIEALKKKKEPIPAELVETASARLPELKTYLASAQYDILVAKGDASAPKPESAQFYLQALKLNPAGARARSRIETLATRLYDSGSSSEAKSILKQGMQITGTGKDAEFEKMLKTIQAVQAEKADLSGMLLRIRQLPSLAEKTQTYLALFSRMDSALSRYGAGKLGDLRAAVCAQIKADVNYQKQHNHVIPPAFMSPAAKRFPEIRDFLIRTQYDILIAQGNASPPADQAGSYLEALKLDPGRAEALGRIEQLALELDRTGSNGDAVALLKQALEIAPAHEKFQELLHRIQRVVRIFVTPSGCGQENILIYSAPVSSETLNLCIQYLNLKPDTIISVLLENENSQSVEVPVVLNGRSGNKGVTIEAPVEGFVVGTYSIYVKQNDRILSETRIEFVPKRR